MQRSLTFLQNLAGQAGDPAESSGLGVSLQLLGEGPHTRGVVPSCPCQARLQEAGFQQERPVGEAAAFGSRLVEPPSRLDDFPEPAYHRDES